MASSKIVLFALPHCCGRWRRRTVENSGRRMMQDHADYIGANQLQSER
jgi:hypothetical protein